MPAESKDPYTQELPQASGLCDEDITSRGALIFKRGIPLEEQLVLDGFKES
jgi:hypothetical protein